MENTPKAQRGSGLSPVHVASIPLWRGSVAAACKIQGGLSKGKVLQATFGFQIQ